jgi:glycosyltransferase involved in cell wall biosynthesis
MTAQPHLAIWYTPFQLGGVETFLHRFARATSGLNVAAVKSADGPLRDTFPRDVRLFDWSGFDEAFFRRAPSIAIASRIAGEIADLRPRVVNLNDCIAFGIGAAPLLRAIRPWCAIVDVFHIDHPSDDFLELRRDYIDLLDGVIATSPRTIGRLRKHFRVARDLPGAYIPCGIEVVPPQREPFDGTLRLLFVGRVADEQKRVLLLPPLLAALRDRGVQWRMTIVGDGPDRERLSAELRARGLHDLVTFAGFVAPDDVRPYYWRHDLHVNVSAYEGGFATTTIEALAAGCVPLQTALLSLDRAMLRDGENCLLIPRETPESLIDIVAALTPARLAQLSAEAIVTGAQLSIEGTVEAYDRFFKELFARRPLAPWPAQPSLPHDWNIGANNPWMPATNMRGRFRAYASRFRRWRR